MVEHRLAKARVAGSNPVSRSNFINYLYVPRLFLLTHGHSFSLSESFYCLPKVRR